MKQFELIISTSRHKLDKIEINISRMALRTGYSSSHLSRVFRGKTTPSMKCLIRIAEVLKIDIVKLHDMLKIGAINAK